MSCTVSRRRALGLFGGSVGVALASACSNSTTTGENVRAPGTGGPGSIKIPDSGARLPKGDVTIRWVESAQFSKAFLPTFWVAYKHRHPNVKVNYQNLPDADLTRVLQVAFQGGGQSVPDVFRLAPAVMSFSRAVAKKLVQPIDDLIPHFTAWKSAFPKGSFLEGMNVFNGKTYSFPMLGTNTSMLMYNAKYLEQAGIDPLTTQLTFDTFRQAARELTKQGGGKYYGLTLGGADNGLTQLVLPLAGLAGSLGESFNHKTGTYSYTSDGFKEAVEFLIALKRDKSIDPGAISIPQQQALAKLPAGQAAMIVGIPGNASAWLQQKFDFGIAGLPVPTGGRRGYIWQGPPNSLSYWWVSARTKDGPVIGDIFHFLGSLDGQKTWQRISAGGLPVINPQANMVQSIDKRLRHAYDYFHNMIRIVPQPQVRNADVGVVLQEQRPVTPALPQVLQGIYTGQIDNPTKALTQLQASSERELDRAIKAAQKKGAHVSRNDWVFSDWDPTENYYDY